eukprot:438824_1
MGNCMSLKTQAEINMGSKKSVSSNDTNADSTKEDSSKINESLVSQKSSIDSITKVNLNQQADVNEFNANKINGNITHGAKLDNFDGVYDIAMYENMNQEKCNGYIDCSFIKRIMTTLSYYNQVSSNEPQKFIDFCDKYYSKQYLEDYIHFICVHKNDINK